MKLRRKDLKKSLAEKLIEALEEERFNVAESVLTEKAPPDDEIEKWIKDVKPEFKKEYGDDWEKVLYAKAWNKYNEKHGKTEESVEEIDVFLNEDTGEYYYIDLCEDTLKERKVIVKVNSRGERRKKIQCPSGRVAKKVGGRTVCTTPSGRERLTKKLATRKTVRTKKAKGAGYKKRVNFKRQRAMKKRKSMGLKRERQDSWQESTDNSRKR